MKVLSWNVNGLRAIAAKTFWPWLKKEKPDVLCMQEIKAKEEQLEPALRSVPEYNAFYFPAVKPGYAGTAIFSRERPDEVWKGIGAKEFDSEGRVLGARFGALHVISAYFPNSQPEGVRLKFKSEFCKKITSFLKNLVKKGQHIILCGDYNIAHTEIDLARPKENEGNPGYFPEERQAMTGFLESGFADVFREAHPGEKGLYTWWSFRGGARGRNVGWRIDYTCVDEGLKARVKETFHQKDVMGSDHCPVGLVLK